MIALLRSAAFLCALKVRWYGQIVKAAFLHGYRWQMARSDGRTVTIPPAAGRVIDG